MSWFLCTIAKQSARNWEICKNIGLWGISTNSDRARVTRAVAGDNLLFWLSSAGYLGYGTVLEDTRPPISDEEAPWGGGRRRYGLVVPMHVEYECERPVWIAFENNRQKITNIPQFALQRGFALIPDQAAKEAIKYMKGHKGEPRPAKKRVRRKPEIA